MCEVSDAGNSLDCAAQADSSKLHTPQDCRECSRMFRKLDEHGWLMNITRVCLQPSPVVLWNEWPWPSTVHSDRPRNYHNNS